MVMPVRRSHEGAEHAAGLKAQHAGGNGGHGAPRRPGSSQVVRIADTCARGDVGADTYPLAGRTTCSAAQASWEMMRPPSICRPLGLGIHLLRSSACTQRCQQSGN